MAWPKGKRRGTKTPGSGRTKGTKNIAPGAKAPELRDIVLRALGTVGGQKYLEQVARADPKTFLALIGRLLPTRVEGEVAHVAEIRVITGFEEGPPG